MGFFDFLHGRPPKSEAQEYMEKRNKEYAKKVALYNKLEANSTMVKTQVDTAENYRKANSSTNVFKTLTANLSKGINDALGMANEMVVKSTPNGSSQTASTIAHNYKNSCNTCSTTPSIYDSKYSNIFDVKNASARPADRSVIASGIIQRGSFKVGDTVTIKTVRTTKQATILGIWRRGEKTQYANASSGQIGIVLSNSADTPIKQGDKILL